MSDYAESDTVMRHPRFSLENDRGFTLVEMIIAVSVFAISLLAFAPLLTTAVTLDRDSMLKVKARALAAYKMDELIAEGLTVTGCDGVVRDCTAAYSCTEYVDSDTDRVYATPADVPSSVAFRIDRTMAIAPVTNTNLCRMTISTTYQMANDAPQVFTLVAEKGR
ncbi:MAG: hypothetical protein OHK006_09550 [Thermodesulfovibrionales bacterium]